MRIIVINGYPQAGKDTFIKFCGKYTKVANYSTVDKVKEALLILGWDGVKTPEIRKVLSDLKDLSTKHFDGPVKHIKRTVNRDKILSFKNRPSLVFIHSREPEEIQRFKQELGALTLLIKRTQQEIITNHADRNVEEYDYDMKVHNTGTLEDLAEAAYQFIELVCNK